MMSVKLDIKDKRILSELDMDSRQPLVSIAKRVCLSKEVVNYRIKQLEKKQIIKGYYTVINFAKLGLLFCRFFLRFQNVDLTKEKEIAKYASNFPQVCWVVNTKGPWDMVFVILTKQMNDFKDICDNISFKYGPYFQQRYISIATKIRHMKHNYIYNTNDDREEIIESKGEQENLDELDLKILTILSKNARIPTIDIAKKLHVTPNTIKYRIKKLINKKIILCFRASLGLKKMGFQRHKVVLTLQNMSKRKIMQMCQFLKQNPHVIYITESIGTGDIEFEIDTN